MDGQAPTRTAVRRRVISFEDPVRYVFPSTCLSQRQPGDSSADNDDRVLEETCGFQHFIGVTRWRLGRYAGFSFDRNMLQGTFGFDIVAFFQLHLTVFCATNPVAGSFRVRRSQSADLLLRMHGDVSFEMSNLFRHGFLQRLARNMCRARCKANVCSNLGLSRSLVMCSCMHEMSNERQLRHSSRLVSVSRVGTLSIHFNRHPRRCGAVQV